MTDSVDIDDAAVTAVISALRTRATTWTGHGVGLGIEGVGVGVRARADAVVSAFTSEFTTAGLALGDLADGVQSDVDGFGELDAVMASSSSAAGGGPTAGPEGDG
jgi:hypothetical protein